MSTPILSASSAGTASPQPKLRRALLIAGVALVAVLSALIWYASEVQEHTAISELPAQERHALYQRTLHTLETTCAPDKQPSGLETFCRDQAEFVVQFPECDQHCRSVASPHRGATR
jgi:cytochrome b pre-mRNA-processing protein 3